jgi:hypothetical protein
MTQRKGEITRRELMRRWPHHIALPADQVHGLANSEVVRSFADTLGGAADVLIAPRRRRLYLSASARLKMRMCSDSGSRVSRYR